MEKLMDIKPALSFEHANIYYLEQCRVIARNHQVRSLCKVDDEYFYANLPTDKPTVILLGDKTKITPYSLAMFAEMNILVGMQNTIASLLSDGEIEWFSPSNIENPDQHLQSWLALWLDDDSRIELVKQLQRSKLKFIEKVWASDNRLIDNGFCVFDDDIFRSLKHTLKKINYATDMDQLTTLEKEFTQRLYRIGDYRTRHGGFNRNIHAGDKINVFLNHAYFIAHGIATAALRQIGIPHDLCTTQDNVQNNRLYVILSKTIKDTLALPYAFISAKENKTLPEFRELCLNVFAEYNVLDFMIDEIKHLAIQPEQRAGDAA